MNWCYTDNAHCKHWIYLDESILDMRPAKSLFIAADLSDS